MTTLAPEILLESIFRDGLARIEPDRLLSGRLAGWLAETGLDHVTGLRIGASGKAAVTMTRALLPALDRPVTAGLVVGPEGSGPVPEPIRFMPSDHPLPTQRSVEAAAAMQSMLSQTPLQEGFIFLLSGGTSAMLETPRPPLTLADLQAIWQQLLDSGLDIYVMNRVRTALSSVKGGGLLTGVHAPGLVIVMSDVPGNNLSVVGSGPLFPGAPAGGPDLKDVLAGSAFWEVLPEPAKTLLSQATPMDPGRAVPPHVLLASNETLVRAVTQAAQDRAVLAGDCPVPMLGEARYFGASLAAWCRQRQAEPGPDREVWMCGGETTVSVSGDGIGGRCQEAALAALWELQGHPGITILVAGSDGVDGPTSSAGAIAGPKAWQRAAQQQVDLPGSLRRHDSHHVWHTIGGLVETGPTGVNVADVAIALIER